MQGTTFISTFNVLFESQAFPCDVGNQQSTLNLKQCVSQCHHPKYSRLFSGLKVLAISHMTLMGLTSRKNVFGVKDRVKLSLISEFILVNLIVSLSNALRAGQSINSRLSLFQYHS